jgi:hypothetical protein
LYFAVYDQYLCKRDWLSAKFNLKRAGTKTKFQRDLSAELAHSIKVELDRFSTRYNTVKTQELTAVSKQKKLATNKQ